MSFRRLLQAVLIAGGLVLVGVGFWQWRRQPARAPGAGPMRVAVMPYTDLTSDPGLDWVGDLVPTLMAARAEGLPEVRVVAVSTSGEAAASGAARLVQGTYTGSADRLSFQTQVEDIARHEMSSAETVSQPVLKSLETLSALPARWSRAGKLQPFPTQSLPALKAFAALRFDEAVKADPGLSIAWRAWGESAAQQNDRSLLRTVVARGSEAASRFTPLEQARWRVLAAQLSGDKAAFADALVNVAKMLPQEVSLWDQAAATALSLWRIDQAIALYQAALKASPNDGEIWNSLGYAYSYSGRLQDAMDALRNYARVAPETVNPLDSMGEVQLRAGRFTEAAQAFEQAYAKDANFLDGYTLFKAAVARYFAGDKGAAQSLADKYLAAVEARNPAVAELDRADWLYLLGKDAEARAAMKKAAELGPQFRPAIERRLKLDELGTASAPPPGDLFRALWLSARGEYAQAEALWRTIHAGTSPVEEDLSREMLLACLIAEGKRDEADKLKQVWPLPRGAGEILQNPPVLAIALRNRASAAPRPSGGRS